MKKLTVFLLTSGLAVTALHQLGRRRLQRERKALRKQERTELHRWEDEGGNLPPRTQRAAVQDGTRDV